MAPTKVKLSSHGKFLIEHLKNGSKTLNTDLMIRCQDGDVGLHRVIIGATTTSLPFMRCLKSNVEDDELIIIMPEVRRVYVEHIRNLLYTGQTETISQNEIEELNAVINLLKIRNLPFSLVEGTEVIADNETESSRLTIEVIEPTRKRPLKVQQPIIEEDPSLIRRSKRPKVKNKNLSDFETPLKGVDENESKGNYVFNFHHFVK